MSFRNDAAYENPCPHCDRGQGFEHKPDCPANPEVRDALAPIVSDAEAEADQIFEAAPMPTEVLNLPFSDQICVRTEPELRHVLAHCYYAIEHLIADPPRRTLARHELKSIEGLIFFDGGDEDYESWLRSKLKEKPG